MGDVVEYKTTTSFNEVDKDGTVESVAGDVAEFLPKPAGYRVLIAIPKMKEATAGGILKPEEILEREQAASIIGFVIALGQDAYKDKTKFPNGPWCKSGDFVMMRSYAGTRFKLKGQEYRLINDDVVEGVVEDPTGITKA